jgi:hypothetical protein
MVRADGSVSSGLQALCMSELVFEEGTRLYRSYQGIQRVTHCDPFGYTFLTCLCGLVPSVLRRLSNSIMHFLIKFRAPGVQIEPLPVHFTSSSQAINEADIQHVAAVEDKLKCVDTNARLLHITLSTRYHLHHHPLSLKLTMDEGPNQNPC